MPIPLLDRVTATGADDSVMPEDLQLLQSSYPFAEWGILISEVKKGGRRFPSERWIRRLCELDGLKLSTHLCGRYVRQLCQAGGDREWISQQWLYPLLMKSQRIQLNFHARCHDVDVHYLAITLRRGFPHAQIICQADGVNDSVISGLWNEGIDVAKLFDKSGGAGELPATWPTPSHEIYCGYAGGLSAGNVTDELEKIAEVVRNVHDMPVWIDAETRLRSMDNALFSLPNVSRYLEAAGKWVITDAKKE